MQRNIIFNLVTIYFIAISCSGVESSFKNSEDNNHPNILVVLCDDLGYSDVGFNGGIDVKTPTLDHLAEKGTIFNSAYVAHPFCGPSRASIMTGRYAHTMGAQFNLPPNSEMIGKGISKEDTYISKVMQSAGYYTGAIGKWHLGAVEEFHPNNRGFDDFYGFLGGGHNYYPKEYSAKYAKQKAEGKKVIFEYLLPLEHNGEEVYNDEYLTDQLSHQAVRFVTEAKEKEKPFFLYLAYNAPHVPLEAKAEDYAKFADIKDDHRRSYAAMVYSVDRGVEEVVKALKANGQYENTLIVFFSDNGGKLSKGATNNPLREGKGSVCEGGYRVPMFFHWPDKVPEGVHFNYSISALDLYPTFAHLGGATVPKDKILDGKDIWDDFLKNKELHKDETLFCLRHRTGYSDVGVRNGEWKALRLDQEAWALYNVDKDREESNDLSSQYPDVLKRLVTDAEKWSRTHKQPEWWHDEQTGIEWKRDDMPRFDETFRLKR